MPHFLTTVLLLALVVTSLSIAYSLLVSQDIVGGQVNVDEQVLHTKTDSSIPQVEHANRTEVALVGYCKGSKFAFLQKLVKHNRQHYADMWGYEVLLGDGDDLPFESFITPPAWLKVVYVYDILQRRSDIDWLLWMDCDAFVSKMEYSVSQILNNVLDGVLPHHYMIMSNDPNSLFNTGVVFVKNCNWSRAFWKRTLQLAANETIRNHIWWEQKAMQDLYVLNAYDEKHHIHIVHERYKINALRSDRRDDYTERESFIWHRVNCHKQEICDGRSLAFFCAHMPAGSYPESLCRGAGEEW